MRTGKLTERAAKRIFAAVRRIEGMVAAPPPQRNQVDRHPPQIMFAVRVTIDGGSAGSASTTCSWTYTVTMDSGYLLGEEMSPEKCRLPNVPYVTTPDDSWGAGFFDKAGVFVLWDANECPQVEEC
jgi:hypothetical protein